MTGKKESFPNLEDFLGGGGAIMYLSFDVISKYNTYIIFHLKQFPQTTKT